MRIAWQDLVISLNGGLRAPPLPPRTQGTEYFKQEPKGSISHLNHTMYPALPLPAIPSLRNHNSISIAMKSTFLVQLWGSYLSVLDLFTYHNDF